MEIKRDQYLNQLIRSMDNGAIKVITGIRRCGKSYLLDPLFHDYLVKAGVPEERIIKIDLSDAKNQSLCNPLNLSKKLEASLPKEGNAYLFIDEIQLCEAVENPFFSGVKTESGKKPMITFYAVLNGLLSSHKNVDVYVTGSNSKMLSSDILTDFRGRGCEIRMRPLSFLEYLSANEGSDRGQAWRDYLRYGGMPFSLRYTDFGDRENYLRSLFETVYYKDIIERNHLQTDTSIREFTKVVASSVGSLTNVSRIADTFRSTEQKGIGRITIDNYIRCLEDSFLLEEAERYDVRGRHIMNGNKKYYFVDTGLRNALLNFRQPDRGHLMENVIYNELLSLGYGVDVGAIRTYEAKNPPSNSSPQREIDFIAEKGNKKYYIQSAYSAEEDAKMVQEKKPLLAVRDSFPKILIEGDDFAPYYDNDGIIHVGVIEFLLRGSSLLDH